jgi:hypothetical protein
MRWQDMPEGKEKYSAYLCGREWAVLKEQVKSRSGGMCERCNVNPMDHVHHLTYKRKYAESLTDLQACCKQCHEFIHAKSDRDPARDRPIVIPWCKRRVKSFYLAGKITGTDWRSQIVSGWGEEKGLSYWQAFLDYDTCSTWSVVPNACDVAGVFLHYTGPWWQDFSGGGHSCASDSCEPHGYSNSFQQLHSDETARRRREVSNAIAAAISSADLIFAWIDSADCFGTIVEIGYAKGLGKVVVVATSDEFAATEQSQQMWLLRQLGYCVTGKTPSDAWGEFWNLVSFEQGNAPDGKDAK